MEVKLNELNNKILFKELKVGDTYLDEDGVLCIKAGDIPGRDDWVPVLAFVNENWLVERERQLALVTKVESTLIIKN